jgi:uncharacterized protein YgiB involved in biofilm formation
LIALMASVFALVGCGDDSSGGSGGSPCDECVNQGDQAACEISWESCNNPDKDVCRAAALEACDT